MVNPPTEPECSDEETLSCSQEGILPGLSRDPTLTFQDIPAYVEVGEEPSPTQEAGSSTLEDSISTLEDGITATQLSGEEALLAMNEEPSAILVDSVDEVTVIHAALTPEDTNAVAVAEAPAPEAYAVDEKLAVDVAMVESAIEYIHSAPAGEALSAEEICPSPCVEPLFIKGPELEAPPLSEEPVKLVLPKHKNKPRSNRRKAPESAPAEPQPVSPLAAQTKSYSAVCRSGAEVLPPAPSVRPASPEEVRVAVPLSQPAGPGDQWENLPASLAASPERWQRKRDRKRKSKKSNLESTEEEKSQEELSEPVKEPIEEKSVEPPPAKEATP
jgi:hypothetical protein